MCTRCTSKHYDSAEDAWPWVLMTLVMFVLVCLGGLNALDKARERNIPTVTIQPK